MEDKLKFYVDKDGIQLGGFYDSTPTVEHTEVPAPNHGNDVWDLDNKVWILYNTIPDEAKQALADSDKNMARIGEDLIDLLVNKGVIALSDFDSVTQAKLTERKNNRIKIGE